MALSLTASFTCDAVDPVRAVDAAPRRRIRSWASVTLEHEVERMYPANVKRPNGDAWGGRAYRLFTRAGGVLRRRSGELSMRQPLYRGTWRDDIAFAQPVNVPLRILRRILERRPQTRSGVTVVIVNYNSSAMIRTVVRAVREFSPSDTQIIVVDNASRDDSWSWLRTRPLGIRALRSPANIGSSCAA